MKTNRQLSDNFLEEVVSVLNLNDFRFTQNTWNTNVNVSNETKTELKKLCKQNKNERTKYNRINGPNKTMNTNWSYDVMSLYFNL